MPVQNNALDTDYVVGALVVNSEGRIFVQRRSKDRKLFPGCWDIVGGHVEHGETLEQALVREVYEETGWTLSEVCSLVKEFHWKAQENGATKKKVEFDFIVSVEGDLTNPKLEANKHDCHRWVSIQELSMLLDERNPDDTFIHDVVKEAFEVLNSSI